MRKSMKLGAASTLAAVALLAGSASAASAEGRGGNDKKDGPFCSTLSYEGESDGDGNSEQNNGFGDVIACQFGKNNNFNYIPTDNDVDGGDTSLLGDIAGDLTGAIL
ncbi:hypothetical protein [Streptomyces yerevanensis]|uniref:hypothetical protein n=1 Tax=Streptomyces yerevanensis TaxID=66378 RepID=UPI0005269602|nr:hypothetical protein [Streptomyces yerevanensis]